MTAMTISSRCFRVHRLDASPAGFPSLSSPSHPGPHLLFLGLAVVLGLLLMAAVKALQHAVFLQVQSVLHTLTNVPVGWLGRGAFGHCWPTTVEPRQ